MKKMLVTDYDNTFYTDEESIKKNIEKVEEFKRENNIFVIATSRSEESIKEEIKKYNIKCDYIICNSGAIAIDNKNEQKIYKNLLNEKTKEEIEQTIKKYENENINITRFKIKEKSEEEQESLETCKNILGYKIKGEDKKLEKIKQEIDQKNLEVESIYNNKGKLFFNGKSKKEDAIEEICNHIKEQIKVITVGDEEVDIGMIKKYDGYLMEQSPEAIQQITNKKVRSIHELIEKMM